MLMRAIQQRPRGQEAAAAANESLTTAGRPAIHTYSKSRTDDADEQRTLSLSGRIYCLHFLITALKANRPDGQTRRRSDKHPHRIRSGWPAGRQAGESRSATICWARELCRLGTHKSSAHSQRSLTRRHVSVDIFALCFHET